MSKRNTFLDAEDEDDDDFDRSDVEESKTRSFQSKRRKLDTSVASPHEKHSEDDGDDDQLSVPRDEEAVEVGELETSEGIVPISAAQVSKDEKRRILTKAKLEKQQRKVRKTGVVYISRVPPFMKPTTLRQLLTPYGNILRIFLTPEPAPQYQARVRAGGNKKKSFVDGWVEFESKQKAKVCTEMLNGNIIGGKKGGFYHDDIWNLKYLKGFKWNDLMEQVQNEEREREGRLQAEIERERRERKVFLQNAERAKIERGMEAKRQKKRQSIVRSNGEILEQEDAPDSLGVAGRRQMTFKQNAVRSSTKKSSSEERVVPRTLRKIF